MGNTNSTDCSDSGTYTQTPIDETSQHRGRSLLEDLHHIEQQVSAVHEVQKRQAAELAGRASDSPSGLHRETSVTLHGVRLVPGAARIVVGPVIGKVSQDSARVLLEVDRPCRVTCHASIVSDECPTGNPAASQEAELVGGRPFVFSLRGLPPSSRVRVCFSGVQLRDATGRTGRFTTLPLSDDGQLRCVAVSRDEPGAGGREGAMWEMVQREVQSTEAHFLLHLGGQVDCSAVFGECAMALSARSLEGPDEGERKEPAEDEARAAVKGRLRDMYRLAWNLPGKREALASCGNLMIWSDQDLRKGFAEAKDGWNQPLPHELLNLAQLVYREYQRALWDEGIVEEEHSLQWNSKGSGNEECHFHMFGGLGIFFVDPIGSRLLPDGSQELGNPFISKNQWDFLQFVLKKRELRRLLVVSPSPIVARENFADMDEIVMSTTSVAWDRNQADRQQLVETLIAWKRDHAPAEVTIICGGGNIVNELSLKHNKFRTYTLPQFTTGPLTAPFNARLQDHMISADNQHRLAGEDITVLSLPQEPLQVLPKPLTGTGNSFLSLRHSLSKRQDRSPAQVSSHSSRPLCPAEAPVQGRMVLGPVIGKVTSTTAVVLAEVDQQCLVTCRLQDTATLRLHTRTRQCPGGEPFTWVFSSLLPDRRYHVTFAGEVTGHEARTGLVCTSAAGVAPLAAPVPRPLALALVVDDQPASATGTQGEPALALLREAVHPVWGGVSAAVHLGGQVDLTLARQQAAHYLRCTCPGQPPESLPPAQRAVVEEALLDILRSAYRFGWNLPAKRQALAHCANLMLRGESDLLREVPGAPGWAAVLVRLSQQVFREYQRQLWDANSGGGGPETAGNLHGEQFSHLLHGGQVGLVGLDVLARTVDAGGRPVAAEGAVLNAAQWEDLESTLASHEFESPEMCLLVVASEFPFVKESSTDAGVRVVMGGALGPWTAHPMERDHLFQLLFAWRRAQPQREVVLVAGGQGTFFTSTLRCLGPAQDRTDTLRQLVCGPCAGQARPFAGELEGVLEGDPGYEYTHQALGAGQQGFGVVQVVPSGQGGGRFRVECRTVTNRGHVPQVCPAQAALPSWVVDPVKAQARSRQELNAQLEEEQEQQNLEEEERKVGESLSRLGASETAATDAELVVKNVTKVLSTTKADLKLEDGQNEVLGVETKARFEELESQTRDSGYIVTLEKAFYRFADDAYMSTADFEMAAVNYMEQEATEELRTLLFESKLQDVQTELNPGSRLVVSFSVQVTMHERTSAATRRGEDAHMPISSSEFGRLMGRLFEILILVRPALAM